MSSVADPGFSRGGGREPSRGGVNTPNFPENCMKSKEFGRPGGGRASLTPPLDPPMVIQTTCIKIEALFVPVKKEVHTFRF